MGGHIQKWVEPFNHQTLRLGISHKWFDESSRLIEWFLDPDNDWIMFGLTANLFCIFDICLVSTVVVLVKNDVRTWFPLTLLIKDWLSM